MSVVKTIGVMTSGGDCSGLNAAIRSVVTAAVRGHGWTVYGLIDGTSGLLDRPVRAVRLDRDSVGTGYLRTGGTVLGTINKADALTKALTQGVDSDLISVFAEGAQSLNLEALVVIGGDGSMRILSKLCQKVGLNMVGIPKTVDNDVHKTDRAIGFSSTVQVVCEALDRLQSTAESHRRVMVVEVMGRDSGHIAMTAGMAGGADAILVPEIPYTLSGLTQRLQANFYKGGPGHALVVVAEGVTSSGHRPACVTYSDGEERYGGIGHRLAEDIFSQTSLETRATVLGHIQRGGPPSADDRLLASLFGVKAVDLIQSGRFNHMTVWHNGTVSAVPLHEVTVGSCLLDKEGPLVQAARALGVYVGDV